MKKSLLIVALLAAVTVLAVMVLHQRQQINQLQQPPAVAAATPAKPAPPPVQPVIEPPALAPVAPLPPAPAAVPPPAPSGGSASNFFAGLAGMMKDPQMKEMIRAQQKMVLVKTYGSLFQKLNLPTDRLDALKELLLERQMAMTEAGMAMMSGGTPDRKQAMEQTKTIKEDYDKKIEEALGATDYPVFRQFEDTQPERMQLQMFKETLAPTEMLNDQQETMLIAAMYEERKALPATSLVNSRATDPSQLTEERITETLQQLDQLQQRYAQRAAAVLGPVQMQQFTKFQEQWRSMQAAGLKMAVTMFGTKTPAPAPPPAGQ
jgi:hypothetical protein